MNSRPFGQNWRKGMVKPMAGPWLYVISRTGEFTLANRRPIPGGADKYRELVKNGRIVEDRYWWISQNWKSVEIGDEMFIYSGDGHLGIIGYATVAGVEQRGERWLHPPSVRFRPMPGFAE